MSTSPKLLRVGSADDALMRALAEHCGPSTGWRVEPLDGPTPGATLAIVDFDEAAAQRWAIGRVREMGFDGQILVLGGPDHCESPKEEQIARPVRLGALLSRIEACLAQLDDAGHARLGPYWFIVGESLLKPAGEGAPIRLTELECRLLSYLTEAHGDLVGREQLLAAVWGYSAGLDTHTVETHIWRLRQKIETDDPATRFLVTESGGYRLLSDGVRGCAQPGG